MKKYMFAMTILGFASVSFASNIQGQVKIFTGRTVETHRPFSYAALLTKDGQRIGLPGWIKGERLAKELQNKVSFSAEILPMYCTDMSGACLSGVLRNIRSAKIEFKNITNSHLETYSSRLQKFMGRAVETPSAYNYIAIEDHARVAVPEFLDAELLYAKNAEVTVVGELSLIMCTDMSDACGPSPLIPLKSAEIHF